MPLISRTTMESFSELILFLRHQDLRAQLAKLTLRIFQGALRVDAIFGAAKIG